jgi:hypothetical protein
MAAMASLNRKLILDILDHALQTNDLDFPLNKQRLGS